MSEPYRFLSTMLAISLVGMIACKGPAEATLVERPLAGVTANVNQGSRDEFFQRLRNFAENHAFEIRIVPIRPGGKHFAVDMWRRDLKILGDNPLDEVDPARFRLDFYRNGHSELPADVVPALLADLRRQIAAINGVEISE